MEQPKASSCKDETSLLPAIDDDSCDKEVSEITSRCRNELEENDGGESKDRSSSLICEKDEESPTSALASGSSQSSACVSCTTLQNDYSAYKNAIECNLGILKEKIVTTDELIKNYHKKCQENGKLLKKVEDLTEKLKKCYNETGALRVQLEKAKQANEPLKKAAARFEIEKNYSDHQVLELKKNLRSTQAQLDDLRLSAMAIDKKSTTIETGSKKLERENEALNNRLAAKVKEVEKLKGSLKEVRAAKRKSEQGERNAIRQLEKISGKLTKSQEGIVNLKETTKKSPQKKRKTKKTTPKTTDTYEREWRKGPTLRSSKSKINQEDCEINSESDKSEKGITSDDEITDDTNSDQEVAAIFNTTNDKFTQEFLKDFAIPSPPLSPIPPSPAPRRAKVGHRTNGGTHREEAVVVDTDICESKDYDNLQQAIPDISISEEHLSSDEDSEPGNQHLLIAEKVRRRYLSDSGIAKSNENIGCTEFGKRRSKSWNNLCLELDQTLLSDIKKKLLPGTADLKHEMDQIMEFEDDVRPTKYTSHVPDGFERSYSVCSSSNDDAESRGDSQILGSISSDDDLGDNVDDFSSDSNDDYDNDQGDANLDDCDRDFTNFNPESSFGFDAEVHTMDVSNNGDHTETSPDDLKGGVSVCVGNIPIDGNIESDEQTSAKKSKLLGNSRSTDVPEASRELAGDTASASSQSQPEHSLCTDLNFSSIESQMASKSPSNKLPENEGMKTVEGASSFSIYGDVQTGVLTDTEDGEKQLGSKPYTKRKPGKLNDLSDGQDETKTTLKGPRESLNLITNTTTERTGGVFKDDKFLDVDDSAFDNDKSHVLAISHDAPECSKDKSRTENFESENDNDLCKELNPQKSSAASLEVPGDRSTFPGKPSKVKIIAEYPNDITGERGEGRQTLECLLSEQDMPETANSQSGSLSTSDRSGQSKMTTSVKSANVQESDKRDTDMSSTTKNDSRSSSVDSICPATTQSIFVDESLDNCKPREVTNGQRTSLRISIEEAGQSSTVADQVAQKRNDGMPMIGNISVTTISRPAPEEVLQDNRQHSPNNVIKKPTKSGSAVSAGVKSTSKGKKQSKSSLVSCKQKDIGDCQRPAATCTKTLLKSDSKRVGPNNEVPNCSRMVEGNIDKEMSNDQETTLIVANIKNDTSSETIATNPPTQDKDTSVVCSEDNRFAQLVEPNMETLVARSSSSSARSGDDKSTENEGSLKSLTRQVTAAIGIPPSASASTSSYSAAYFQPIIHESPSVNVSMLFASIGDVSDEFSNELTIDTIISEETSIYTTLSPLPPTPPRHRLTPLLSPLPVTPLPDIVSPLLSPPELSSLPTFRESKVDGSASQSINVAKPRAVLPSSMRMLNFNSIDRCASLAEAKSDDETRVDNHITGGSMTSLKTVNTSSLESEAIINERENAASDSQEPLPKIETLLKIFKRTDGSHDRDDLFPINRAGRNEMGILVEGGKTDEHSVVSEKENIDRLLVSASYKNIEQSNCQIFTKSLRSKSRVKKGKRSIEDDGNEQCSEGGALTANDDNIEKKTPTKSNNKKRKASAIHDESPKRSLRKRDENGNVVKEDEPRRSRRLRGDEGVTTPKNKGTSAISKNANKERSPTKVSQRASERCKTSTEDEIMLAITSNRTGKNKGSSSKQLPERTRGSKGKRKSETESELDIKCLKSDQEETKTRLLTRSPDDQTNSKCDGVLRKVTTDQTAATETTDASTNLKQDVESFPLNKEKALGLRKKKVASPGENASPITTRRSYEVDHSGRKPGIELETTPASSCALSSDLDRNCKSATTPMENSVAVTDAEESSKCSSKNMSSLSKESPANLVKSTNSLITSNRQITNEAGNVSHRNSCRKTVLLSVEEIPHAKSIAKGSDCAEKCQTLEVTSNKQPGNSCETTTTAVEKAANCNWKKQAEVKQVVNTKRQKVTEDLVATKPISGRNLKQSQVEYAQQCLESLRNISSPKEVVQNFSMFKNISSASSIVSAIITYLKVNTEGNMSNVYRRLGCVVTTQNSEATNVTAGHTNATAGNSETMNVTAGDNETANVTTKTIETANLSQGAQNDEKAPFDNSEPDNVCESFTRKPELARLEQMILTVVAECAKVPHLGAVIKVLFNLLPKAILSGSQLTEDKLLSLCRVYTALCRGKGETERFKDFFVQFVCDTNHAKNLPSVLITCYCIWPKFFCVAKDSQRGNVHVVKENPIVNSIQVITAWLSSENGETVKEKALQRIFGSSIHGEDAIEKLCDCLLECLKDAEINTDDNLKGPSDEKQFLGSHANAVIQSLELISLHKGWEWCNDYLIADRLWSIFRNWSKQLTSNNVTIEDKVADATIASAIRLIGRVCQIGIKDGYEDFTTIIKMCSGILTRSSLCSKISLPVQVAAAHTLLDISSTDLNTISLSLNSWLEKAVVDIPEMLQRKIMSLKVPEEF